MGSPLQIIFIDDDASSRAQLSERLSFADITHTTTDYVSWLQGDITEPGDRSVIWLGHCSLPISLEKLIHQFDQLDDKLPVIAISPWPELDQLSQNLQEKIIGRLNPDADLEALTVMLHRALIYRQLQLQYAGQPDLFSPKSVASQFEGMVGHSEAMALVRKMISQVAGRDVNVLITGDSGTGKEIVANNLHKASKRSAGPFVPVNCGAIPADLLESELFGHEKGAFTGAISSRAGRFELANGGTLFLDEIGDMPLPMQVKLLRVLQERCFERVGGSQTIDCDVRIIAATHKDLDQMIIDGSFREDLYYRLNVFPIDMPRLRSRIEDIPPLVDEFTRRLAKEGFGRLRFHPAAIRSLQQHDWAGNIRELANLIERLAILYPDAVIGVRELPEKFRHIEEPDPGLYKGNGQRPDINADAVVSGSSGGESIGQVLNELPEQGMDLKLYLEKIERGYINQALDQTAGVVARAADLLQIRRTTLVEKMRKYGIQRK
ncbi:sigma-54 interaction domain-containing protein [Amphritea japonica]|uniref:Sigma-54 specific transcriptional regulator, flagellar regulatory protein A n=1 Tax=Amphritea japonica ATCC BAA-1530 TaxID=1278309 RepID=A0A7R6P111_9GAMM|nr:sigma-54 dependent transcriptional regulator [Amphritea japonica]BBB25158.1 sigma-54 specific transcriptional regulator, flagellar regulatory protein A [Amphritea japonica ATCC BAA-1530]